MQGLKNLTGDILGYARCPVTHDTYWHTDTMTISYSRSSGILILRRALDDFSREEIAQVVFSRGKEHLLKGPLYMGRLDSMYSLEQVLGQIPEGKHGMRGGTGTGQ